MQKFSRKSEGSKPHTGLPIPGILHWGDKPLEHLALKASVGRPRGLWEIETPLLNGTHRISHTPRPRAEAVI